MGFRGQLGSRGLAGADRPDRLVGDDQRAKPGGIDLCQSAADLAADHFFGFTALPIIQMLANAHDRHQAMVEGSHQLEMNGFIRLREVLAALRVAEDHVRDLESSQHGSGNLACVCAFFSEMHVLRADPNPGVYRGALHGFEHEGQIRCRWADHDLWITLRLCLRFDQRQKGAEEAFRILRGLIHLPIGGNEGGTHSLQISLPRGLYPPHK